MFHAVYGKWTTWGSWGSCDVTCGGGSQVRTRTCNKNDPSDLECVGGDTQDKTCSDWNCPGISRICLVMRALSNCFTDIALFGGSMIAVSPKLYSLVKTHKRDIAKPLYGIFYGNAIG